MVDRAALADAVVVTVAAECRQCGACGTLVVDDAATAIRERQWRAVLAVCPGGLLELALICPPCAGAGAPGSVVSP